MTRVGKSQLTKAERQVIELIRELRRRRAAGKVPEKLDQPAYLARHLILLCHGHVQVRMTTLAPQLGVTLRTLQRSFKVNFQTSMKDFAIHTRLSFAQELLSKNPDIKMSVVANHLGYDDPNVFERFFRKHAGMSPGAWSKANDQRRGQ